MSTPETVVQEWKDLPWPQVEKDVFTLQRRIYRASVRNDPKVIHRLQRLLLSSWSAKCLAVRRVTQDNQGKKTAGVDGISSLAPEERLDLVANLNIEQEPKPTRRVWIPKPGSDEKRPLGIPTMHDRALQALVLLAMEPEWEARFEPNSYGFRPGRSCHDAIHAIWLSINKVPKYALDADIAKCFDRISHEALLNKINTFPMLRRLIQAWLKAGVLDGETLFPTAEGTPQGGVISPLLANIALHGLEEKIRSSFNKTKKVNGNSTEWTPTVVRYADDFVVLHRDFGVIQQCKVIAQEWLKDMGLELKPSKTRFAHTLNECEGRVGFDFLGVTIRQFPVGKYKTGKNTNGKPLGFTCVFTPSKEKVKLHVARLSEIVRSRKSATQGTLISLLNPVIRGWSNYYRTVCSTDTFSSVDRNLYQILRAWARRRHPKKSAEWVAQKYWRLPEWKFGLEDGFTLRRHTETKIKRHVKVTETKTPYDGDWVYWTARAGYYPGVTPWLASLLKKQQGKCAHCNLYLRVGEPLDVIEVHHVDRDRANNKRTNLQVLHRHCHDAVHRLGRSVKLFKSINDNDHSVEEPCEVKVSSTVLKTSTPGD